MEDCSAMHFCWTFGPLLLIDRKPKRHTQIPTLTFVFISVTFLIEPSYSLSQLMLFNTTFIVHKVSCKDLFELFYRQVLDI